MNGNEDVTRTSHTTDRSLPDEVEVAVVGAGPTGLTLAGMLSGYGIRTAVLDGAAEPARHSRAAVVHARTLESLEPLGVVGEMLGGGVVVPHFGVRDRDCLLLGVDFDGLPTTHPYTLMLPQDRTECIPARGAPRAGREGPLEARSGPTQSGRRGSRAGRAGCEGREAGTGSLRRRLRRRAQLRTGSARHTISGRELPQSFVLADVRMSRALPDDEVQLFFSPEGLVVVAPLPQGHHRV